jgi:hypothetical protein
MLSIHQQDPAGCRRRATQDNTDLAIQREANAWDVPLADRELVAQAMEALGRLDTARRLRETNARRARPELAAVPDPGGRRLKSKPDRPILVAVDGGNASEAVGLDDTSIAWARIARSAEHSLVSLSLGPNDAEELRRLAQAARSAVPPPPERSA